MFELVVVVSMGVNNRYDKIRPVSRGEADEARALHTIARLVSAEPPALDSTTAGQIAHVLDATAIELNAGRAVPIGMRRAVRGLANALRVTMDPRSRDGRRSSSGVQAPEAGDR